MKTEIVAKLRAFVFLFFILISVKSMAQAKTTKGWFYTSFGWHRIYYSKSTIHFYNPTGPVFDFRILKARAHDDHDLRVGKGNEPPQWSVRFGYLFNNKKQIGVEFSYDHAKYYLTQGQTVRLKGTIDGTWYDKDTLIHRDLISYEHTDGANYYMLSLTKRQALTKNQKHHTDLLYKAGAGIVNPRTDSRVIGFAADKEYHLSGYIVGLESTLRHELIRNLFAELSLKAVYANYTDVLLFGDGRAGQKWLSGQILFTIAYQIPNKSY